MMEPHTGQCEWFTNISVCIRLRCEGSASVGLYCTVHSYVNDYTDWEKAYSELCRRCMKVKFLGGKKTCRMCRERTKMLGIARNNARNNMIADLRTESHAATDFVNELIIGGSLPVETNDKQVCKWFVGSFNKCTEYAKVGPYCYNHAYVNEYTDEQKDCSLPCENCGKVQYFRSIDKICDYCESIKCNKRKRDAVCESSDVDYKVSKFMKSVGHDGIEDGDCVEQIVVIDDSEVSLTKPVMVKDGTESRIMDGVKCKWYSSSSTRCKRIRVSELFCDVHAYVNNYTEEQKRSSSVCTRCRKVAYLGNMKRCIHCRAVCCRQSKIYYDKTMKAQFDE